MDKPHWTHVDEQLKALHRLFSEHQSTPYESIDTVIAGFIRDHVEYVEARYVSYATSGVEFEPPHWTDRCVVLSGLPGMSGHVFLYETFMDYNLLDSQIREPEYEDLYAEGRTGSYLELKPSAKRFVDRLFDYLFDPFPERIDTGRRMYYL